MVVIAERNCVRLIGSRQRHPRPGAAGAGPPPHGDGRGRDGGRPKRTRARGRPRLRREASGRGGERTPTTVTVQGDSGRLVQVLVNLVSNAVKFSLARGGAVRDRAREQRARARRGDRPRPRHSVVPPVRHLRALPPGRVQRRPRQGRDRASASPSARPSSEQHGERSAWRARSARGARSGSRSLRARRRPVPGDVPARGRPAGRRSWPTDASPCSGCSCASSSATACACAWPTTPRKRSRPSARRHRALLVVDLGLPEGEGRAPPRSPAHGRAVLSLVLCSSTARRTWTSASSDGSRSGPRGFTHKSRATDVEVRTVVSEMLGAEAREAQP